MILLLKYMLYSGLIYTVLVLYYGNLPRKRSLGITSTQCRYFHLPKIHLDYIPKDKKSKGNVFYIVEHLKTVIGFTLQVIGAVGFMNQRLDIPKNVDPQWVSIIESCWHRFVSYSFCHHDLFN